MDRERAAYIRVPSGSVSFARIDQVFGMRICATVLPVKARGCHLSLRERRKHHRVPVPATSFERQNKGRDGFFAHLLGDRETHRLLLRGRMVEPVPTASNALRLKKPNSTSPLDFSPTPRAGIEVPSPRLLVEYGRRPPGASVTEHFQFLMCFSTACGIAAGHLNHRWVTELGGGDCARRARPLAPQRQIRP